MPNTLLNADSKNKHAPEESEPTSWKSQSNMQFGSRDSGMQQAAPPVTFASETSSSQERRKRLRPQKKWTKCDSGATAASHYLGNDVSKIYACMCFTRGEDLSDFALRGGCKEDVPRKVYHFVDETEEENG